MIMDTSYTGNQCYRYVDKLIRDGKEVLIVSPYLDAHYARFLRENAGGKKIRILSSAMDPDAGRIIRQGRRPGILSAVLLILFSSGYLAYSSGISLLLLASALLPIVLLLFLMYRSGGNSIEVRIPKGFVHAKIYVSENEAISGSANLTYSGMHRNTEHIEISGSGERLERLRKEFQDLWQAAG